MHYTVGPWIGGLAQTQLDFIEYPQQHRRVLRTDSYWNPQALRIQPFSVHTKVRRLSCLNQKSGMASEPAHQGQFIGDQTPGNQHALLI